MTGGEIVLLDVPYLVGEENQPNYVERATLVLQSAYRAMADKDWEAVRRILKDFGFSAMSDEQAIRYYYLDGLSHAALGDEVSAEIAFRHALDHVTPQIDEVSVAMLHTHLARAIHNQQRFPAAIDEHNLSLQALETPGAPNNHRRIHMRLDNLLEAAGEMLILCQFEAGLDALSRALSILEQLPTPWSEEDLRRRITVFWLMALMNRWMGAPQTAYNNARAALDIYDELRSRLQGNAPNGQDTDTYKYARLETVAANCLLDTKPIQQPGMKPPENLVTAQNLIADALMRFRSSSGALGRRGKRGIRDRAGFILAQLADLRAQRFAQNDNRSERLQRLWDIEQAVTGDAEPDAALIGEANLALADEYAYQGNAVYAHMYFIRVVDYLNVIAPALALRARKALEHDGKFPSDML